MTPPAAWAASANASPLLNLWLVWTSCVTALTPVLTEPLLRADGTRPPSSPKGTSLQASVCEELDVELNPICRILLPQSLPCFSLEVEIMPCVPAPVCPWHLIRDQKSRLAACFESPLDDQASGLRSHDQFLKLFFFFFWCQEIFICSNIILFALLSLLFFPLTSVCKVVWSPSQHLQSAQSGQSLSLCSPRSPVLVMSLEMSFCLPQCLRDTFQLCLWGGSVITNCQIHARFCWCGEVSLQRDPTQLGNGNRVGNEQSKTSQEFCDACRWNLS